LKSQPKKFWSYIRSLKSTTGLPNTMSLNHQTAGNGEDIISLFSNYFSSVYNNRVNSNSILSSYDIIESSCVLNDIHIDLLYVFYELEKLELKL